MTHRISGALVLAGMLAACGAGGDEHVALVLQPSFAQRDVAALPQAALQPDAAAAADDHAAVCRSVAACSVAQ